MDAWTAWGLGLLPGLVLGEVLGAYLVCAAQGSRRRTADTDEEQP
ncbi:hypothetical protein [Kineococcus gypseus]